MLKTGDSDFTGLSNEDARRVIAENQGLIRKAVERYKPPKHAIHPIEDEDLVAVAQAALLFAYHTYDPEKATFSTWAYRLMSQELRDVLKASRGQRRTDLEVLVREARAKAFTRIRERCKEAGKPVPAYAQKHVEHPTEAQIADARETLGWRGLSLSTPIEGTSETLESNIPSSFDHPLQKLIDAEEFELFLSVSSSVLSRQEQVVLGRLLGGERPSEIAEDLGISRQRVDQVKLSATERLRRVLLSEED